MPRLRLQSTASSAGHATGDDDHDATGNLRPTSRVNVLALILILVLAAALRLYGLDWDGGHWLHPDERQIYFVTIDLGFPSSLAEALDPASPLNPGFFAYGSFPFYLLKLASLLLAPLWPAVRDPDNLHLIGRPLVLLFDLGTVYLTYRLARVLRPSHNLPRDPGSVDSATTEASSGLLVALLVSLAVLHVQLAHFYTADPLLTFFVMLTLNLAADVARGGGRRRRIALGVSLGLALATKVSTALLILVVLAACHAQYTRRKVQNTGQKAKSAIPNLLSPILDTGAIAIGRCVIPTLAMAAVVFVVLQPYALIDWPTFLEHTVRESEIAWGRLDVPYTRQYAGTLPYLYSTWQTALWGLALPLGVISWACLAFVAVRWLRRGLWADALLLAWAGVYFAITGTMYTKYLRYMLPLVPILCVVAVQSLASLTRRRLRVAGYWVLAIAALVFALVFLSIYSEQHPWIRASTWLYRNVPAGRTLSLEEWDTALPLPLDVDGQPRRVEEYDKRVLPLYHEPDDIDKWVTITADLADSDYLLIASRRLYGSIPRLPDRYPLATRYYERLFAGELGFELVAEFTRGPAWLNPRLPPLPDPAPALLRPDESFVVYDHPRALLFRNVARLSADELLLLLE